MQVGAVIRTEPTLVPTFTPYLVRLHRFFVPLQLYHPEMRVNASGFDMRNLSFNGLVWAAQVSGENSYSPDVSPYIDKSSCLTMLRLALGGFTTVTNYPDYVDTDSQAQPYFFKSGATAEDGVLINCDAMLGYWDIVRNYYSYSQLGDFSFAFPAPFTPVINGEALSPVNTVIDASSKWKQFYGKLSALDRFYEREFYPRGSANLVEQRYLDRSSLFSTLFYSPSDTPVRLDSLNFYKTMLTVGVGGERLTAYAYMFMFSPLAVVPANPDRFSRTLEPANATETVPLTNVTNIRELAVASRLQEYLDLLGAGGSRFSDWLQTFFAAKIKHVDRPALLYSSSFYLNSQPIFNNADQRGDGLGSYAGSIMGQDNFGKRTQTYYFEEPGYLMDCLSIVPLYYWSCVQEDYASYDGSDYFNPLFNEIGFQTLPVRKFNHHPLYLNVAVAREPAFNEFRASYDEVLGEMAALSRPESQQPDVVEQTWVQQRYFDSVNSNAISVELFAKNRFVDIATVNKAFASNNKDNFYLNMYYNVTRHSLVSKRFATRLATR